MRLAMTVVGLGLSMIIVGGMSMITIGMHDWVSGTQQADTWDVSVNLNPIFNEHVVEWVDQNEENYEYEWAVVFPFTATDDRRAILVHGIEQFSEDGVSTMHETRLMEGRLPVADQPIPEVVIEQGVAQFLEWQIGDQISLHIGVMDFPFKVVGIVDEGDRSVWVHRSDLVRDIGSIGENVHNVLYLRNIGGADAANDTSLQELSGTTMLVHADIVAAFDEAWEKNSAGFKIFIAVGAAIAFAVLLNTLAINLTEHDNEFATLRILGASTARIANILCFENLVIGLLGGLAGAYASIRTAMWLGSEFTTWSWYFSFPIRWDIVLWVIGLIMVCSLAVTPIGALRVRKMDLVKKAQEFSY
jgi:ABC-type lipoprotein release transport system permease subunit